MPTAVNTFNVIDTNIYHVNKVPLCKAYVSVHKFDPCKMSTVFSTIILWLDKETDKVNH